MLDVKVQSHFNKSPTTFLLIQVEKIKMTFDSFLLAVIVICGVIVGLYVLSQSAKKD